MKNKNNLSKRGRTILPSNAPKTKLTFSPKPPQAGVIVQNGQYFLRKFTGVYAPMGFGPDDIAAIRHFARGD